MIGVSPVFSPVLIKGLTVSKKNPFQFQFLVDEGDEHFSDGDFEKESYKMIKYFLASLAMPERDMWVNLSPYEKDRIIPEAFGKTEMGRDLLAQDYILKQLTSSLMHPEGELGKVFWQRIYEKAAEQGITDIPVETFNKVWIVPQTGYFYEHNNTVLLVDAKLKVMLEEDYVAVEQANHTQSYGLDSRPTSTMTEDTKKIIRETIIPVIEKEVNEGKNFANLRQIYNAMLMSVWFKKRLKQHIFSQVYADQKNVGQLALASSDSSEKIWNQYVSAFQTGVYDVMKEEYDPSSQQMIPRKYFSGGAIALDKAELTRQADAQEAIEKAGEIKTVNFAMMMSFDEDEKREILLERLELTDEDQKLQALQELYEDENGEQEWDDLLYLLLYAGNDFREDRRNKNLGGRSSDHIDPAQLTSEQKIKAKEGLIEQIKQDALGIADIGETPQSKKLTQSELNQLLRELQAASYEDVLEAYQEYFSMDEADALEEVQRIVGLRTDEDDFADADDAQLTDDQKLMVKKTFIEAIEGDLKDDDKLSFEERETIRRDLGDLQAMSYQEVNGVYMSYFNFNELQVLREIQVIVGLRQDDFKMDDAQLTDVGGMNLRSDLADIQITEDANGFKFPKIDPSMLKVPVEQMIPVIQKITPLPKAEAMMRLGLAVPSDDSIDEAQSLDKAKDVEPSGVL